MNNDLTQLLEGHLYKENANPTCVVLPPGWGKTTTVMDVILNTIRQDITHAGMVLCVERLEAAKSIKKELNKYYQLLGYDDGFPLTIESDIAFVMESAWKSEACLKEFDDYAYGLCRGCQHWRVCPTGQKYWIQQEHPVVIITHPRLYMDRARLDNYRTWRGKDGTEYERKLFIIDEKPPLVPITRLTWNDLIHFEQQVYSMKELIPDFTVVENLISEVKVILTSDCQSSGEFIHPILQEYSADFKNVWLKHYDGKRPEIINEFENLVQKGGYKSSRYGQTDLWLSQKVSYDWNGFNVIILDGTGNYDADYSTIPDLEFWPSSPIKEDYSHLNFYFLSQQLSKAKLKADADIDWIHLISNEAKNVSNREKVLVLCYKEAEAEIRQLLSYEISKGRICVNH